MTELARALYERDGEAFVPTGLTRGPWDPRLQHAGPPTALLARAIEEAAGVDPGFVARLAVDILRPVPIEPLTVSVSHVRPGRRVELLEATLALAADSTPLMRATAWRLRAGDSTEIAAIDPPPDPPESAPATTDFAFWTEPVAYHRALEWRFVSGGFGEGIPACVWTRLNQPLIAGTGTSTFEHLLVMADAASGVSAVLDWSEWTFVNVDFNVHLERPPSGDWVAMDARTRIGDRGSAQCVATLHDRRGRVGVSTQTLLVEPR